MHYNVFASIHAHLLHLGCLMQTRGNMLAEKMRSLIEVFLVFPCLWYCIISQIVGSQAQCNLKYMMYTVCYPFLFQNILGKHFTSFCFVFRAGLGVEFQQPSSWASMSCSLRLQVKVKTLHFPFLFCVCQDTRL